jgi:hypothetical protein
MTFKFRFIDSGREPQCPADPDYPNGIDLDVSAGALPTCCYNTPYPAPRCGVMKATCERCGLKVAYTVAGRADDPRSLTMACAKRSTEC